MAKASARRRSTIRSRGRTREGSPELTPTQSVSLSKVLPEDRAADGGIGSELGDSYVEDIAMRKAGRTFLPVASERQEDDEVQDAGIMGLLTQIYGHGRSAL